MPSLIETYAKTTGFKIDKPWMKEDFFPLPFEKYITLPAGSAQGAKCYDYFQEVINMLNPIVSKFGYSFVMLGGANEPLLSGVYDLRGKTNLAQSYYILKRAKLHFGNDTWTAHAAGWLGLPLVVVYGSTDKYIHGPYWKNESKTKLLESHRRGCLPTYSAMEFPKTVNFIPPEQIANSILELLEIQDRINLETYFIGPFYQHTMIEVIPDTVPDLTSNTNIPYTVRMDYHHDEAILQTILQSGRQINILTNKEINLGLLNAFRKNILSYNHEIDKNCSLQYIKQLKSFLPRSVFFTKNKNEAEVADMRLHFFDVCVIEHVIDKTKEDFYNESKIYLNKELDKNLNMSNISFKTNKYIYSKGKMFLSHAHVLENKPANEVGGNSVIDNDNFWKELYHFMILKINN